jgi:hypothetical protein
MQFPDNSAETEFGGGSDKVSKITMFHVNNAVTLL